MCVECYNTKSPDLYGITSGIDIMLHVGGLNKLEIGLLAAIDHAANVLDKLQTIVDINNCCLSSNMLFKQ